MDEERQISVDPRSLQQSSDVSESNDLYPSFTSTPQDTRIYPPPLPPKFASASLPSSATSSPRLGSMFSNIKKWKNQSMSSLARQQTSTVSPFAAEDGLSFRRSKSCGEGRSSMYGDEFTLWTRNLNDSNKQYIEYSEEISNYATYEVDGDDIKQMAAARSNSNNNRQMVARTSSAGRDDNFKCGACMFLPAFGKGKPVRSRKEILQSQSSISPSVISRTISLEKFECGSWASSAIMNTNDDNGSMSLYFDLPLEMIQTNDNDTESPVHTAFVFEKDRKGVLKKNRSRGEKSIESDRHVRFSTSSPKSYPPSPSPISPRLLKARDDFNAYLQAQGV